MVYIPISSIMYGIFPYIYHKNEPNVGKYTIHGWYGSVLNLVPVHPATLGLTPGLLKDLHNVFLVTSIVESCPSKVIFPEEITGCG